MTEALAGALRDLGMTSPVGAALALVILAMVAALLLLARVGRLFGDMKEEARRAEFQAQLMKELATLREREGLLMLEVSELRLQNAGLAETLAEMKVSVALLREQSRRLIDALRDVREGRVAPNEVVLPQERG